MRSTEFVIHCIGPDGVEVDAADRITYTVLSLANRVASLDPRRVKAMSRKVSGYMPTVDRRAPRRVDFTTAKLIGTMKYLHLYSHM